MMVGFIDTMRAEGHAVESICRVLREQGCQIAARTYRAWKNPRRLVAARTVSNAVVVDKVRDLAWTTDERTGLRKLTPEGLYGRRKMTALVRRGRLPDASAGAVDRAMRILGLSGVRRDKGVRTTIPAKDGKRAGDLLDRDLSNRPIRRDHQLDGLGLELGTELTTIRHETNSPRPCLKTPYGRMNPRRNLAGHLDMIPRGMLGLASG